MLDVHAIDTLINEHAQALALSWLHRVQPNAKLTPRHGHYWIGIYHPERPHLIELIDHENLSGLKTALKNGSFYPCETQTDTTPQLLIFCAGVCCEQDILHYCRSHGIPVLQSSTAANAVQLSLAHCLALHSPHQLHHGVMLNVYGEGVLLLGESGIGKSALALELIARGHSLVADDTPLLHRIPGSQQVYALSPPLLADLLEVRALGLLNVCKLFGPKASTATMPVHLVIELREHYVAAAEQRLNAYSLHTSILDTAIPYLPVPISHAANPVLIVETATKNHVLYKKGYDASAILTARQQKIMNNQYL